MQQVTEQLKTMIHHILHRYKFYRLHVKQYNEILQLLSQPFANDPHLIQQNVFRGIVQFNRAYKDQIAPQLSSTQFQHISMETKTLLHKILHEFHFLNCIRAYEMFQQRFQQPATISQANSHPQILPFDDQFEKARLHYMYYGPYSIYHMNGILPHPYPQNNFSPYSNEEIFIPKIPQDLEFPPNIKLMPNNLGQKDIFSQSQECPKNLGAIRGRPPKDKKKMLEKYFSRKISEPLRNILLLDHNDTDILQERDERLQFCVCRGFVLNNEIFPCSNCTRLFHLGCCRNSNTCLGCMLKKRDPFNKVIQTLGMFYLDWWDNYSFEEIINMKTFDKVCSTGRFEVMISCIRAKEKELTWPDGAVFSINEEVIFQIPPLLVDLQLQRRKDTSLFITSNIFQEGRDGETPNFEKVKFNLQATIKNSIDYRDNRRGIFLFGVFLIQKLSIQRLSQSILNDNRNSPTIHPLQKDMDNQEMEIDHLTISCLDPFSKQLMETPVKGKCCKHFNCFDLTTFLTFQFNSLDRLWKCPLCREDARYLIVDKFQLRVVEEIRDLPKLPHRVIYYKDGKIDLQDGSEQMESEEF